MNSARNTHDLQSEEQASLYVLELLPPLERRDFERKLAEDAALRELVRELQGNVEALVLAEPTLPAPVRVWGRIAAEVKLSQAPLLAFSGGLRGWGLRVLAAAACVGLGAWLHLWLATPAKRGADSVAGADPVPASDLPVVFVTNPVVIQKLVPIPVPAEGTNPPTPATVTAQTEVVRLRQRVNTLASQVAALNQVLTQRLALPDGVTRLHVFQLVSTNNPDVPPSLQSLPETLAQLATGQLVVPTPTGTGVVPGTNRLMAPHIPSEAATTATTPASTSVATTSGATSPANSDSPASTTPASTTPATTPTSTSTTTTTLAGGDQHTNTVASLGAPQLNNGQPIGFINPDTGNGVAILSNSSVASNLSFVAWQSGVDSTGAHLFFNVGNSAALGGTAVIPLRTWTNLSPSFFITLEPTETAGSIVFPGGQVIATPPGQPGHN